MRTYQFEIEGVTPLLMHHDDITWADQMEAWRNDPENKKASKAGDDRTPSWRWHGCLYHDNRTVCIPQTNLMRALMEGGAMVPVPGAKGNKTFKSQSQSGMMIEEAFLPIIVQGKEIPVAPIFALRDEPDFAKHREAVEGLGFSLFVKRAKVNASKHIRVRPQFSAGWTCSGTVAVWDEQITEASLVQIFDCAGRYKGLGDWRPGGKTPGSFGIFKARVNAAS
jgi:hypothetical protein